MGSLRQHGVPASGADGARTVDHQVGAEHTQRYATAIGALYALRAQGGDFTDGELGWIADRLHIVAGSERSE
jgi:hypothetical protein